MIELRAIVSTLLIITFTFSAGTGLIMYFFHELTHEYKEITNLHVVSSIFMSILVPVHFALNFKMYKNELRIFFK